MKHSLIQVVRVSVLGALMAALAACSSTHSGPTYSVDAVRIPSLQVQAYRASCHGLFGSASSCMQAANEVCEGRGVTSLEVRDGLHSGVADNDPRELTFICGTPPIRQSAPVAQAQPQPAQTAAPVAQPTPRQVLLQGDANFSIDSAALTPRAKAQLDTFVRVNQGINFKRIVVTGFTDSMGLADRNVALSRDRAATVVSYLRLNGVRAEKMVSEGRGAADPVASNATPEGRMQNRRVEVRVSMQ